MAACWQLPIVNCLYFAAESALAKQWSVAEGYRSPLAGLPAQGPDLREKNLLLHVTRTPE